MTPEEKQNLIRRIASQNLIDSEGSKILWSRHGIAELTQEGWDRKSVEQGLRSCTVIENYPTLHRPLPDCLILSLRARREPFHAVIAIDETNQRLFVVTVYTPSTEEWHDDWQTRKE